jgi:hypothetical protein
MLADFERTDFPVSRQIVNTGGQGLAASDAVKAGVGGLAVAIIVLLIFFGLNRAAVGDRTAGAGLTGSSMGAPAPAAT